MLFLIAGVVQVFFKNNIKRGLNTIRFSPNLDVALIHVKVI